MVGRPLQRQVPAICRRILDGAHDADRTTLIARDVNWTLDRPVAPDTPAECKIRYRAHAAPCRLVPQADGSVAVTFDEPQRDVTPGQGAIFYQGDLCLGGGIIG